MYSIGFIIPKRRSSLAAQSHNTNAQQNTKRKKHAYNNYWDHVMETTPAGA